MASITACLYGESGICSTTLSRYSSHWRSFIGFLGESGTTGVVGARASSPCLALARSPALSPSSCPSYSDAPIANLHQLVLALLGFALGYPSEVDILKMLSELQEERRQIGEAILALERLALVHGGKRRGRPPAWMTALKEGAPKRRGRPPGSKKKPKTTAA
jgi:hypothetical protein